MITTPQDYLNALYQIQDPNRQNQIIKLPVDEKIYNIDLEKRTIEAPEFLSVEQDHAAETIYFRMDRYFDLTDLARDDLTIVVQYKNANPQPNDPANGFLYWVPYIDITTEPGKILFPWLIEGPATKYAGTVVFSIMIYSLDSTGQFEYILNTIPSKSKVLHGMDVIKTSENFEFDVSQVQLILNEITKLSNQVGVYWVDA